MSLIDQNSPKTYKLADSIIAAATDGTMGVEEIQHTVSGLMKLLEVKAAEDTTKKERIKRMNATAVDPKYKDALENMRPIFTLRLPEYSLKTVEFVRQLSKKIFQRSTRKATRKYIYFGSHAAPTII